MYIGDSFYLLAGVYDSSGTNLASNYGSFTLDLALNPLGSLGGLVSKTTSSATALFSELFIGTSGNFNVIVSGSDSVSASSQDLKVLALALDAILLETSESSPSVYFDFVLGVTLKDQKGQLWTEATNVDLSCIGGLAGELSRVLGC